MTTTPNSSRPTLAEQRIITAWRKAHKSIPDAAEALGVTYQRVYQVLRRHSLIERSHVMWAAIPTKTMQMPTPDVAALLGCSDSAVRGARMRRRAA